MRPKPLIPDGILSRAIRAALTLRAKLLEAGTLVVDADRDVGQVLRRAWEQSRQTDRTEPWHYYCDHCKDTGWIEVMPDWLRLRRLYGPEVDGIPAYRKCEPCRWQQRAREQHRERTGELDGVAAAGQTKRERKWR